MKFGEKCKELRVQKGLTQIEAAQKIGVGRRTYIDYENNGVHPKKREVYSKLAELFGCDVNYLLTEDEEFMLSAGEKYGKRGERQAKDLVSEISGLFAGGTLSENDKDAVMKALQEAYWDSKKENVEKYTPKKYRKDGEDPA